MVVNVPRDGLIHVLASRERIGLHPLRFEGYWSIRNIEPMFRIGGGEWFRPADLAWVLQCAGTNA